MERNVRFPDFRYGKLVEALRKAQQLHEGTVAFCGRVFSVEFPNGLEHLCDVKLNDKIFGLVDDLEHKAALAADGYLGTELVAWGQRQSAAVAERKEYDAKVKAMREERKRKVQVRREIRSRLREMWGVYGDLIWGLDNKELRVASRQERLAKLASAILDANLTPVTPADVSHAGIHVPWLSKQQNDWTAVLDLVKYIRNHEKFPHIRELVRQQHTRKVLEDAMKRIMAQSTKKTDA